MTDPNQQRYEQELRNFAAQSLVNIDGELARSVHFALTADRQAFTAAAGIQGHVLAEGPVGTGKTTAARAIANIIGGEFGRVQGTPDVTPADFTGPVMLNHETGELELKHGALFSNVVVADELNRASSRAQSALLEPMQEGRVSIPIISKEPIVVPKPFFVVATQNPNELEQGTYPLTKANADRFAVSVQTKELEDEDLDAIGALGGYEATQVVQDVTDLEKVRDGIETMVVSPEAKNRAKAIRAYLREGVTNDFDVKMVDVKDSMLGSDRPYRQTLRMAKALALLTSGADRVPTTVNPDHIEMAAMYTLPHRVGLTHKALQDEKITPQSVVALAIEKS